MSAAYPLVRKLSAFSTRFGVSSSPSRPGSSPSSASSCLMSSCIFLFYISISAVSAQDPNGLYADRANLASARRAADLWRGGGGRGPPGFDLPGGRGAGGLWLGGRARGGRKRAALSRGD